MSERRALAWLFLFRQSKSQNQKLNQGDSHAFAHSQGPRIPLSFHVHRWTPLPHSPHRQPSPFLFLPRPKGSPRLRRRITRQRPRVLLLRRLSFRLRSQHRPRPPHPRRDPRRYKTQTRPHRCLHVPNSIASHPHRPTRIHQRLRHRRLAQNHPHLCKCQLRPPLSHHPRTRTATACHGNAATTHAAASQRHSRFSSISAQFSHASIRRAHTKSHRPEACHPERSEGHCYNPAPSTTDKTRLSSTPGKTKQPINSTPPAPLPPKSQPSTPNRDPYAVHFDHN